jgi:hypothetical protein
VKIKFKIDTIRVRLIILNLCTTQYDVANYMKEVNLGADVTGVN